MILAECAHESDELRKVQFAIGTEIVENHSNEPWGDRIRFEFRHAPEIVDVEITFSFSARIAIQLEKTRPEGRDLFL